jgi:hypothetical protein
MAKSQQPLGDPKAGGTPPSVTHEFRDTPPNVDPGGVSDVDWAAVSPPSEPAGATLQNHALPHPLA